MTLLSKLKAYCSLIPFFYLKILMNLKYNINTKLLDSKNMYSFILSMK